MRQVKGQKDPVMALLRDLQTESGRARHSRFVVEESGLVRRAMDMGAPVECVVMADAFARTAEGGQLAGQAEAAGLEVRTAAAGLLGKMLGAKPTPDALAIVERRTVPLAAAFDGIRPLVQMVEHGESADNLGMLLRSADAAGASAVVLAAGTVDPFGRRCVRGSRGAVFTLPICIAGSARKAIEEARKRGLRIIAASANAGTEYTHADCTGPAMLVVGNEHTGLAPGTMEIADMVVKIPMLGRLHSLNIAVAASVLLYEAVRQRRTKERD